MVDQNDHEAGKILKTASGFREEIREAQRAIEKVAQQAGLAVVAGGTAVIQSAPLAAFIAQKCTEVHLSNLLELREIARGTEAEAYSWPRLMRRLDEMIAEAQRPEELK